MKFTIIFFYIFFYILTLYTLFSLLLVFTPLSLYTKFSLYTLFNYLKLYTTHYFLIYTIFLVFSGLPPTIFFFLKVNILIFILNYINTFFLFFIFLSFFLSTLFYLKIFSYKNFWNNAPTKFFIYKLPIFSKRKFMLKALDYNYLHTIEFSMLGSFYTNIYIIFFLISTLMLSFFIFTDLYLIFLNWFLIN